MSCRVGITTDPQKRKKYWESQHPNMRNWKITKVCKTKADAQAEEDRIARQHGCEAHHGGADANGPWYVYKFDY